VVFRSWIVIASHRVGAMRRPMTGSSEAIHFAAQRKEWIASSLSPLLRSEDKEAQVYSDRRTTGTYGRATLSAAYD
jgi:hypothetical protein